MRRPMTSRLSLALLACALACTLAACGQKTAEPAKEAKKGGGGTLVTLTQAKTGSIDVTESTLGTLEALDDAKIAAEVAGRIASIRVSPGQTVRKGQALAELDAADANLQRQADLAEVARLQALLEQQGRVVERQKELVGRNFVSRNSIDDASAQQEALRNQLAAAQARAQLSQRNVGKTKISAPYDGTVDEVIAAEGDYLKVGDPVLKLVGKHALHANLPFSEAVAARLKRGQLVLLGTASGDAAIKGHIDEIRPQISDSGRSVVAVVRLNAAALKESEGMLTPGGTINASVVLQRRGDAVLVPEQSVVLRPAGKVVYLVQDGKAVQRPVQTGAKDNGMIEVIKGLQAGETVVFDGAGFLSQGAPVLVKEAKPAGSPHLQKNEGNAGAAPSAAKPDDAKPAAKPEANVTAAKAS